jgi:outer membrane protein assembly factor BamB
MSSIRLINKLKTLKLPRLFLLVALLVGLLAPANGIGQTNLWDVRLPDYYCDAAPAIAPDGTIYQPAFDGSLLAITPWGAVQWEFKTGVEIESSPAIGSDGTIYFGSRNRKFYAVTPAGKLKWIFQTGAWNDSSPAIAADGTIYFGSWDKNFYALKPDGSLKWKLTTDGIIDSSPAIGADGTIYFGSHDTKFYALMPDGKVKWSFATGGQIISSPAIGPHGDIYFTSLDGNLYALKPDGSEQWHLLTGGITPSSPVVDSRETIYVAANQLCLAISASGKKLWAQDVGDQVVGAPAATDSQIYFASRIPGLTAMTTNGTVAWSERLYGETSSSPTVGKDGTIYMVNTGVISAIGPTNGAPPAKSSWPMFRANPEHTGRVESH